MEKYSKYLPSKNFIKIAGTIGSALVVIFVLAFLISGKELFNPNKKETSGLKVSSQDFASLIIRDTDGDGIADWEEELWGTDKNKKITFENTPDSVYIASRKEKLNITETTNTNNLTETEKFAREFFASYSALKSSGEVEDEAINVFSGILGDAIVDPTLTDAYLESSIKTGEGVDGLVYYQKVQKLYDEYRKLGLGDELEILSTEIATEGGSNSTQTKKLTTIGNAYKDFAKDALKIEVPIALASYHLRIVNSANNTGISVINMAKVIGDPIVGLSGLSQYQKYSEDLINAVYELESVLSS